MSRRRHEPETACIDAVTHDGRGIAAISGKKVFVAGALVGETVRFQRRKSRRSFDEAELLEVLEPSHNRVKARCEAFGRCGGCALQHVSTGQQREIKLQALKDNLARVGKVAPDRWLDTITGPDWHYRRRARLAVKNVHAKGRVLVGFRERLAPFITDMHRCEVLSPPVDALIDPLSELIGQLSIRSRLPQIEVAVADNAVALVFRVLDPPTVDDQALLCDFGKARDLRIYTQTGGVNSVQLLYPSAINEALFYALPDFDLRIEFEPMGFVQINREVNEQMVNHAVALLDPEPADRVLDLYCGIGNFSLPLATRSAEVLGIEGDPALIKAAAVNGMQNGLQNVVFSCVDLDEIDGSETWLSDGWDRVLLDPARSGAANPVKQMHRIGAKRIVYVSCHPGTLARDADTLVNEHGYRFDAAGIIDMFPHTAHIESIAVFNK